MHCAWMVVGLILFALPITATFQDAIARARSDGLASIFAEATVMDWDLNVISQGSDDWTCLSDRPNIPGNDPWCVTVVWLDFLKAYVNQTEPTYSTFGFAYMLQGDTPVSNTERPTGCPVLARDPGLLGDRVNRSVE